MILFQRNPPLKIVDLIHDLKDGTKLLALLEVLSGQRLPMEKGKILRRPHYLSNINTALQFLISKRIKLVNINPSDIVDGRPAVVLGLIWTIILYFQIEENSRILYYLNENLSGSVSSLDSSSASCIPSPNKPLLQESTTNKASQEMLKQGPKKTLLSWVNNALPKYVNCFFFYLALSNYSILTSGNQDWRLEISEQAGETDMRFCLSLTL